MKAFFITYFDIGQTIKSRKKREQKIAAKHKGNHYINAFLFDRTTEPEHRRVTFPFPSYFKTFHRES